MESVSIWHWLLLVILYLGPMIWSSVRILKRIGFSGWWTVVSIIPLVNSLVWAVPSRRSGFMRCEDISCTLVHLPLRNAYLMATLSLVTLVCPLKGIYGSRRQAMACRFGTFTSCSRRLAFLCGLLLSTAGQAWSAGAPLGPQIKQASVNDVTLSYQEQGDGAPVVFVHGCCTDYRVWDAQRPAIAPHYRFMAVNLRDHGPAPWADDGSKYSVKTHVEDLTGFLRGLNTGPVDLVAWSYSGPIVMLVAAQHPELVHSLFIHEPGFLTWVADPAALKIASEDRQAAMSPAIAASKAGDATGAVLLVPAGVNHEPNLWDTAAPAVRSMVVDNAHSFALSLASPPPPAITCDILRQIKIPALMTYGEETRPWFRIAAEGAANCISGAQAVSIPGRHLAMVQQPDAFNAALLQFLSKVGSQPKP